jgi:hypothetical protein
MSALKQMGEKSKMTSKSLQSVGNCHQNAYYGAYVTNALAGWSHGK